MIIAHGQPVAPLLIRSRGMSFRPAVVRGIFSAIDRRHMRRIFVEIRSPDSELLPVSIDPFPENFAGIPSFVPCIATDAYNIGREPVAIAATEAPAMVRPVSRRLQAARDRLTVVIAERTGGRATARPPPQPEAYERASI